MKKIKIGWFEKIALKVWPNLAIRRLAKQIGVRNPTFDKTHDALSQVRRVDLLPLKTGYRGFMIVLDRKTALYFHQDYDHFVYSGFEIGNYEKGDITIFDGLKTGE